MALMQCSNISAMCNTHWNNVKNVFQDIADGEGPKVLGFLSYKRDKK